MPRIDIVAIPMNSFHRLVPNLQSIGSASAGNFKAEERNSDGRVSIGGVGIKKPFWPTHT